VTTRHTDLGGQLPLCATGMPGAIDTTDVTKKAPQLAARAALRRRHAARLVCGAGTDLLVSDVMAGAWR
jgi:hypothetical protein